MKFSIIVPMYNVEPYIDKCIESLVEQSFGDFEIILVDDCSSDDTLYRAKKWSAKSHRIIVIEKKTNTGLSDTRNLGIEHASGDYLLFVDSDDYIEKDSLRIINDIVVNTNPDIIYAGYIQENENKNSKKKYGYKSEAEKLYSAEEYMQSELKARNLFAAAAFGIYRKDLIIRNGLYFKVGILHEDEHWTPRVLMNANTVFLSSYHFYHYVKREGSITTKKDRTQNGLDLINTCYELEQYSAARIKDAQLQRMYANQLAKLYMKAVCIGELDRQRYSNIINRFFPIKHACKLYDIAKALVFMVNINVYKKLDMFFGDDWR